MQGPTIVTYHRGHLFWAGYESDREFGRGNKYSDIPLAGQTALYNGNIVKQQMLLDWKR